MKRFAVLLYGLVAYVLFFATFLYLIGFVGDLYVPKGIDGELQVPFWQALSIDLFLLVLFGVQHSLMARQWFKDWWTKFVPEAMERSTYLIFTCIALTVLFTFWQPLGGVVWSISNGFVVGGLLALFFLGWVLVLVSSYAINHFDLFGLRQVWFYFKERPYQPLPFSIPILYQYSRYPLYLGLVVAMWSAPVMSYTRLFFAVFLTAYVLKAIQWEEQDMIARFGEHYRSYKEKVAMLVPFVLKRKRKQPAYETLMKKISYFEDVDGGK